MSDPNYSLINWAEYCQQKWGAEWEVPEPVYRFSGRSPDGGVQGRTFRSTDAKDSGAYKRG